jgi:micrococcal nuclease
MIRVVGTSELEKKLYWYKAKVVKIVDADTVDLMVSLGLHSYSEERFRLRGIDAWEVRGKEREKGLLAKARVEELTPVDSEVWIETYKDKEGKYGRFLADIYFEHEEPRMLVNLCDLLVEEGHAEEVNY